MQNLEIALKLLNEHWQKQNIVFSPKTLDEIEGFERNNSLHLPDDFRKFYLQLNGMESHFPNHIDEEGFLFYPLEAIVLAKNEFENSNINNNVYIFAEYMHKSWWYGVEIQDDNSYTIGILPDSNTFKPVTNSLAEFIKLYAQDASELYNHST